MSLAPDFLRARVAVVTGGASGIGLELARALCARGASVVLASRNAANLAAAEAELRARHGAQAALALPASVKDPAACTAVVDRTLADYGRLDILVNNAGANFLCAARAISPNGFSAVLDVVLGGTFYMSQAAARAMRARGGGRIISMGGANGWNGSPLMAHSGAGKAGMTALTRTLAVEWAPFGITVNEVVPGPVDTPGARERLWPDEDMRARIARQVPLGRLVTIADVVGTTLLLLTDEAAFVTGASLVVDGGNRLRQV